MGDEAESFGERQATAAAEVSESAVIMDVSYRRMLTSSASVIANSVQLGDLMDRMAKGQIDTGRAALMLSMNFLQLGACLYTLNTTYGGLLATKAASIALDVKEAAAATTHAIAESGRQAALWATNTAHTVVAAIKSSSIVLDAQEAAGAIAHAVAEGTRQAAIWATVIAEKARALASAIANAISSWGIGVPIMIAAAAAATAGILAYTGVIPTHEKGGVVMDRTLTWVAEREPEIIIPVAKFNEFVKSTEEKTEILRSLGVYEASPIAKYAEGAIVTKPTVAWVAEKEPELVMPIVKLNELITEKVRVLTFAVAHSMPSLEVKVPGMLASATVAAELGVYRKASPLEFLTGPLVGAKETGKTVNITVEIKDPVFRHRGDLDYLVDRLKRMGMA